jgi:secreted PhoX family phosphatase
MYKKIIALVFALTLLASSVAVAQDNSFPTLPHDAPFAAFLDSHNYAIAAGATAEWRKMEGVALDAINNRLYIAVTDTGKGMADTEGDIQMTANKCGAVFEADLNADFDISALKPVVVGGPYDEANADNSCNQDAIANPDNMFVDAKNNLWIGEDTDFHHNQVLWMWNGTELKRFATLPAGAEVTGLRVTPDGTIFLNIQHPDARNFYPYNRATVGVITGYKAGDDFTSVSVPTGDDMLRLSLAAGQYQVLARTGEAMPNNPDGAVFGSIKNADGSFQPICNNPDGNMFLPNGSSYTEGYLYSNWECAPATGSKMYIRQGADDQWSVIEGQPVDYLSIGGTWNTCNASVTPWNTGLTSEEYPADSQAEYEEDWQPFVAGMQAHLGHAPNPFAFGYIIELTPAGGEEDGIGTVMTKHYAMGRFSHEMALVLPDSKTVYFGDDGTDRVLYKFVADNAGDLSAGTLYAAKVAQDNDTLNLTWISLGSGNDADISAALQAMDSASS